MRILGAENGVNLDDIFLPLKCFEVMSDGHQVCFGWQLVSTVSPVSVLERTKAAGTGKGRQLFLDTLEVGGTRLRPVGDRLGEFGRGDRISIQGTGDIDPVKSMQVIEVNHVILHVLDAHDQVTDQAGIVRDLDVQGIFHGTDAGHGVHRGADTAEALGKMMRISGIATLENRLDATEGRG